jgi:hypothetical protein
MTGAANCKAISQDFMTSNDLKSLLNRRLLFVIGKGGVGKTAITESISRSLPGRVLWVSIEDPTRPPQEMKRLGANLWSLNASAGPSFAEYAELKIGARLLLHFFLQNRLVQYLATAAPGIRELVLLGKIWFERKNYDHVVIDMPSTGHGVAMFRSTRNFGNLFGSGPVHSDTEAMNAVFRDPEQTGIVIVSLPEEMPLQESLELKDLLSDLFPKNEAALICNRRLPALREPPASSRSRDAKTVGAASAEGATSPESPDGAESALSPFALDSADYLWRKSRLEKENLARLWDSRGLRYASLSFVAPEAGREHAHLVEILAAQLQALREETAT